MIISTWWVTLRGGFNDYASEGDGFLSVLESATNTGMDGLGFLQSLTADRGHEENSKDDAKLKSRHDAMKAIKNRELNIQTQFNSK